MAAPLMDDFIAGEIDAVYVVYNEFKSMLSQRVVTERLLPIPRLGEDLAKVVPMAATAGIRADLHDDRSAEAAAHIGYIYEPEPAALLGYLLPAYVQYELFHALLESAAAEHAARMAAMDAATKNAVEMLDSLTLYMNKVRQAAITREIIRGAESLIERAWVPRWCRARRVESRRGMATQQQHVGRVVQVIGAVVDIEFEGYLPQIYNAVRIVSDANSPTPIDVIVEVEQHLGENRVRTIAMKPTDGMQRGMRAIDTGRPSRCRWARRRSAAC
jgi:hypothetical protein